MALEVGQADEHIRVHHRPADFCFFYVLSPVHRHTHIIGTLQAIANQNGAPHGQGRKPVLPGALQMLQGIFPGAGIHGVAVRQKRLAAQLLDQIHHRTGVVGPQIADVAQLAEVELDGDKLALHVDLVDSRFAHQLFQLGGQAVPKGDGVKIGKINA